MESYISSHVTEGARQNASSVNRKLAQLKSVMKGFGEDYTDALEYVSKGAFHKANKVIQECEEFLERTGCPEYLREDYLAKAKDSIPPEYWNYYKLLNSALSRVYNSTISRNSLGGLLL